MAALAALNLGKIRLADALIELRANCTDDFLLSHVAVQTAQMPFDGAEVADFLGESHIAICNRYIADWDLNQSRRSTSMLISRSAHRFGRSASETKKLCGCITMAVLAVKQSGKLHSGSMPLMARSQSSTLRGG